MFIFNLNIYLILLGIRVSVCAHARSISGQSVLYCAPLSFRGIEKEPGASFSANTNTFTNTFTCTDAQRNHQNKHTHIGRCAQTNTLPISAARQCENHLANKSLLIKPTTCGVLKSLETIMTMMGFDTYEQLLVC